MSLKKKYSLIFSGLLFFFCNSAWAAIVDFENNPTLATGASLFSNAGPAQTISVEGGDIIFNGGVVLGFATNLPASPFGTVPNIYGTANHPSGNAVGDSSLASSLSIDISNTFGLTTVEGLLFNGMIRQASYTIEAFAGTTLLDSVSFIDLADNLSGGFDVFKLDSGGQAITSVIFTPDLADGEWDFFIDTIAFNEPIENAVVPIPGAVWLFGSGLIGLIGVRKKSSKISIFSA